ncbi:MAG: STAS domain-containing protein [Acidimicrobiia bacterium]
MGSTDAPNPPPSADAVLETVEVSGDLDFHTADSFRDRLFTAIDRSSAVVLDAHALDFIDSSGLSVILSARRRADERGTRFHIDGLHPRFMRLLEITGIGSLISD